MVGARAKQPKQPTSTGACITYTTHTVPDSPPPHPTLNEMLQRLRDYPGTLHLLAEEPDAAEFLRSVFEADPKLADITGGDELGRTPIQHACPECSSTMRAALCLLGRFEIDDDPPLHFSATSAVVQADDIGGTDAKPPRRALKAMRKAEQVLAELNGRDGLDPKY